MSNKKPTYRINLAMPEGLYRRIETYADTMGLNLPEAARTLLIRGMESVQVMVSARDSADALNRMTKAFTMELDRESEQRDASLKKPVVKRSKKARGGIVTPPQSDKNGTNPRVKDIFE